MDSGLIAFVTKKIYNLDSKDTGQTRLDYVHVGLDNKDTSALWKKPSRQSQGRGGTRYFARGGPRNFMDQPEPSGVGDSRSGIGREEGY